MSGERYPMQVRVGSLILCSVASIGCAAGAAYLAWGDIATQGLTIEAIVVALLGLICLLSGIVVIFGLFLNRGPRRAVVFGDESVTLPQSPFSATIVRIPYAAVDCIKVWQSRGSEQLTIVHDAGKTRVNTAWFDESVYQRLRERLFSIKAPV